MTEWLSTAQHACIHIEPWGKPGRHVPLSCLWLMCIYSAPDRSLLGWVPKGHSGNSSTMLPRPTFLLSLFQFFYSLHLGALRSFLKINTCIIVLVSDSDERKQMKTAGCLNYPAYRYLMNEISLSLLWAVCPSFYPGCSSQESCSPISRNQKEKKRKERKPEGNLFKPKAIMFSLKPHRLQGQYKCLANLENLLLSYSRSS